MSNPRPPLTPQAPTAAPRRPTLPPRQGDDLGTRSSETAGGLTPSEGAEAFAPPGPDKFDGGTDGRTRGNGVSPQPPRAGGGPPPKRPPVSPRPPIVPLRGAAATAAAVEARSGTGPTRQTDGAWESTWGSFSEPGPSRPPAPGSASGAGAVPAGPLPDSLAGSLPATPSGPNTDSAPRTAGSAGNGRETKATQPGQWIVPVAEGKAALDDDAGWGQAESVGKADATGKAQARSDPVDLPFGLEKVFEKLHLPVPSKPALIRGCVVAVAVLPLVILMFMWVAGGGSTKTIEAQQAKSFDGEESSGMSSDEGTQEVPIGPDYQPGLDTPPSEGYPGGAPYPSSSSSSSSSGSSNRYGSGSSGGYPSGSGGSSSSSGGGSPAPPTNPPSTNPPAPGTPVLQPGDIGLANKGGNIQWQLVVPGSQNPSVVTAKTVDTGNGCRSVTTYLHTIDLCLGSGAVTVTGLHKNIAGNWVHMSCSGSSCTGQLLWWTLGTRGAASVRTEGSVTTITLDMDVTGIRGRGWYERIVIVDGLVAEVDHLIELDFGGGSYYTDATDFRAS